MKRNFGKLILAVAIFAITVFLCMTCGLNGVN